MNTVILSVSSYFSHRRDLGIIIDRELSFESHVTAVCRAGYNQLRQLRSVVRSLSVHATKTLVQAFISCRLDYCNSLLYGINDGLIRRLQSVQNAAARLVTGAGRRDHITPVLRQLHWLSDPSASGIQGSRTCSPDTGWSRALRTSSTTAVYCLTPADAHSGRVLANPNVSRPICTHNRFGDRSFSAAGPRVWNDLPHGLGQPGLSFATFRRQLETFLFSDRSA